MKNSIVKDLLVIIVDGILEGERTFFGAVSFIRTVKTHLELREIDGTFVSKAKLKRKSKERHGLMEHAGQETVNMKQKTKVENNAQITSHWF